MRNTASPASALILKKARWTSSAFFCSMYRSTPVRRSSGRATSDLIEYAKSTARSRKAIPWKRAEKCKARTLPNLTGKE